jgi:hypothetical protein
MPSKSEAQRRFMQIAAHSAKFAKEADIPQSVAREFNRADQRKKRRKSISKAISAAQSKN